MISSIIIILEYDDFDEKEVAYKRYQRNDALMSKIMSETMVPMNSVPITKTKLNAMRDQVAALEAYQVSYSILFLQHHKTQRQERYDMMYELTKHFFRNVRQRILLRLRRSTWLNYRN